MKKSDRDGSPSRPGRSCSAGASQVASCLFFLFCACGALAGTVQVETLRADEVRTLEISALPDAVTNAVLHYAFSQDMGGLVVDSSLNGHDATALGCVWSSSGRFNGGAMSFFGDVSMIPLPDGPDFPSWDAYTVSAWFFNNSPGFYRGIVDKTTASAIEGARAWYLVHGWGLIGVAMIHEDLENRTYKDALLVDMEPSYNNNYLAHAWHHVVVVRDGNHGQLWVDGVLKDSISDMISVVNVDATLCVGNTLSNWIRPDFSGWTGELDEFMIFDRALSKSEILKLYQNGTLAHTPPPPISVTSDVSIDGNLTVTGEATFEGGIRHVLPLGDLSSGIYTNAP